MAADTCDINFLLNTKITKNYDFSADSGKEDKFEICFFVSKKADAFF